MILVKLKSNYHMRITHRTKSPKQSIGLRAETSNVIFLEEGHICPFLTQADLSICINF